MWRTSIRSWVLARPVYLSMASRAVQLANWWATPPRKSYNLAVDKAPVLHEAFRVLKPGGRFAVSDIVIHGGLSAGLVDTPTFRRDLSSWSGCIAGALTDQEYRDLKIDAGFTTIDLEVTRRYAAEQLGDVLPAWVHTLGAAQTQEIVQRFASTFVRATKP